MNWRILYFSKPAKINLLHSQLQYTPFEGDIVTIPIEDISVIVLESNQILLTTALLSKCTKNNILIFICNESHIPCGTFIPFHNHSRFSQIAKIQINTKEPLKKRLWQKIIKSKIYNQATVLKKFKLNNHSLLENISKNVKSGDVDNLEAYSARTYWQSLFFNFTREQDNNINSALNYGYAILRGAIARTLSANGLFPCFGINHSNDLNAFNLADDIIEPFRPFLDFKVYSMHLKNTNFKNELLNTKDKTFLTSVLIDKCLYNNERTSILNAIELTVESFVSALKTNNYDLLILPEFYFEK